MVPQSTRSREFLAAITLPIEKTITTQTLLLSNLDRFVFSLILANILNNVNFIKFRLVVVATN
jgi:hypothetical protein